MPPGSCSMTIRAASWTIESSFLWRVSACSRTWIPPATHPSLPSPQVIALRPIVAAVATNWSTTSTESSAILAVSYRLETFFFSKCFKWNFLIWNNLGASSGHYTAYTRHVQTGEWHYYNDETVLTRTPQDEDFSHGYVLFYRRRNPPPSACDNLLPSNASTAMDIAKWFRN